MTRTEKLLLPAAALLLAACAYVQFISGNAADKNWLLLAAREWVEGKTLYTDIFEINPPLIVWLYAIPVWLSMHLPFVRDFNVLVLLGFAVIAWVTRLCLTLIAGHPAFAGERKNQWAFALLLAFVFVFCTAPMYFFDREHILLVLTFPYVVRFMPALAREPLALRTRIAIGLLAGIGFCIKPHTVIVFSVLQLLYIARERSLAILMSVENRLIYLLGGLYICVVFFCLPEYLHTVVPMAMATYSAYSRRIYGLWQIIFFLIILGVTFVDFRPRYTTPFRREVYYFLGVCMAYLAYALANNGWAYTYQPLLSIARILAGWVMMEFLWLKRDAIAKGVPYKPFVFGARACGFILLLNGAFYAFCFAFAFFPVECNQDLRCRSTQEFFSQVKQIPASSFGVMSVEFYKWTEFSHETGAHWDTRFNALFMVPQFLLSGPGFTEHNRWIIDYVSRAYAEDLSRRKPDVVFVDTSPEIFSGHPAIDLPAYFSGTAEFREEWKHYGRNGVIDACEKPQPGDVQSEPIKTDCRFDVYRRTVP